MKKAALIFTFVLSFGTLFGQNCTADTSIKVPGVYPEYLDTAIIGSPYSHTLQILAVKDTAVVFMGQGITATVDSVVLDSIGGLPANFTYSCEPASCVYTYENVGCAILEGNPTAAEAGSHPLDIYVTSYARWNSFKLPVADTIQDYVLVVNDSNMSSIQNLRVASLIIGPNPAGNHLNVTSYRPVNELIIMDQSGREVMNVQAAHQRSLQLDISTLQSGVYYLRVMRDDGTETRKFVHLKH